LARAKILTCISICIVLALVNSTYVWGEDAYTPLDMRVQLYQDGVVDIEYTLEVDPQEPRVNVTLYGQNYWDLIILDEYGLPLEYSIKTANLMIDTLGAYEVVVTYSTPDLTNKTASTWSLSLNSSVETIILLPEDAIILGLEPAPSTLAMTSIGIILTMPPSNLRITYTLGASGTKDTTLAKINEAEQLIQEINERQINVTEAEILLDSSQQAYSEENYIQAQDYAEQAIEKAQYTQTLANNASEKINEADNFISLAEESGRTTQLEEAKASLDEARIAYKHGNYEVASARAVEAIESANLSKTPDRNNISLYAVSLIGLSIIGFLIYRYLNFDQREVISEINLEHIFDENPQLRQDEREVVELIANSPEGLFASEIRDRFDLPRSTAWRMINRLEEAEILKTSMIGRETHVEISNKYRGKHDD
jgi:uncharacterized membrane protein